MAKETYYFSHDANARNDEKILMLRADCGMEGYGVFWALIETMFETSETALYHDKIKGLSLSYNIPISQLEKIIKVCIENELFESDGFTFWSNSLRNRKEKYYTIKEKRSEGGKKAMANRWAKGNVINDLDNSLITELQDSNKSDITPDNKGKEIKKKENKKESKVFVPPTLEEVKSYVADNQFVIDPIYFHTYYSNTNWEKVTGGKVSNWKNTVVTWNKKELEKNPNKQTYKQQSSQSEYTGFNDYYDNGED